MKFLNIIVSRWKNETPDFFKKLRFISIIFLILSLSVVLMNFFGLKIYETILVVSKFIMSSSTTLGITSQLTQKKCEDDV